VFSVWYAVVKPDYSQNIFSLSLSLFVCVCLSLSIYIHIYTHSHIYTHTYIYTHIYIYIHTHIHTHTHTHIHIHTHILVMHLSIYRDSSWVTGAQLLSLGPSFKITQNWLTYLCPTSGILCEGLDATDCNLHMTDLNSQGQGPRNYTTTLVPWEKTQHSWLCPWTLDLDQKISISLRLNLFVLV
jgi:hypothetical protein